MSEACPQRRKAEEAVERDIPMVSQLGKEVFPDHFKRVDCEPDRSEADGEERSKDQEQGGADQHVDGFLSCAHAAMILPARKVAQPPRRVRPGWGDYEALLTLAACGPF